MDNSARMSLFEISAILLTASAAASYINYRWIKLPPSIGLMLLAMLAGLIGILLETLGLFDITPIEHFLKSINFSETVFHGMLSFLLFAGALQINIQDLKNAKLPVALTATFSTFISTILIGLIFYYVASIMGFKQINLLIALLFGAIISPTDPIAVMAIIRKMNAPKSIETQIAGESLFNDGVAIVFFLTILELITNSSHVDYLQSIAFLIQETAGGLCFGIILGLIAYHLLANIHSFQTAILITLALTTGGYVLAEKLLVSAPIAMVIAGIIIGNQYRHKAIPPDIKLQMDSFWEVIEEILNAVLFILIGLEMMIIKINVAVSVLAIICIFLTLIARYVSVAIPIFLIKPFYSFRRATALIMTWGGLRGALSIAMVLTLEHQSIKDILLPCVYFVVVFSIAVQGLTFSKLLKKYGFVKRDRLSHHN
jgi:CPA1 family monovalent cation:H+ antiporter